jgi:hypothetical protein
MPKVLRKMRCGIPYCREWMAVEMIFEVSLEAERIKQGKMAVINLDDYTEGIYSSGWR